jgi:hypothetical protein
MNIISYTYEADYHCVDCTKTYVHVDKWKFLCGLPQHSSGCWCENASRDYDINGVAHDQTDSEGNLINPVFSTDEWQNFDEGFIEENPTQYLTCGDCHEVIEEYTHESRG